MTDITFTLTSTQIIDNGNFWAKDTDYFKAVNTSSFESLVAHMNDVYAEAKNKAEILKAYRLKIGKPEAELSKDLRIELGYLVEDDDCPQRKNDKKLTNRGINILMGEYNKLPIPTDNSEIELDITKTAIYKFLNKKKTAGKMVPERFSKLVNQYDNHVSAVKKAKAEAEAKAKAEAEKAKAEENTDTIVEENTETKVEENLSGIEAPKADDNGIDQTPKYNMGVSERIESIVALINTYDDDADKVAIAKGIANAFSEISQKITDDMKAQAQAKAETDKAEAEAKKAEALKPKAFTTSNSTPKQKAEADRKNRGIRKAS